MLSAPSAGSREPAGDLLTPEVEDPLQIAPHEEPMRHRAERPQRQRVAHHVAHDRAAVAVRREFVCVVPQGVRPAQLTVDEAHAGLPVLDLGEPPDRQAVQPQPVLDDRAGAHRDRAGRGDGEPQPRRGDRLEVAGVGEEGEDVVGGAGQALLPEQGVVAEHRPGVRLPWVQRLPKRRKRRGTPANSGGKERTTHLSDVTRVSVEIGGTEISFETGKLAKQASGAVTVRAGDTVVLSTATAGNQRDVDFLPLTVDVEERMYAAGKIPGSFFKREGRAGEKGTLVARMIDRPLRPLFPKGWNYETQLVTMPLSVDHVNPYDILGMNGASAALMVSNIPFPQPVGAVRIGKIEGNFVINPTETDLAEGKSDLDLVVSGTDEAILMVEAGANVIPEAEILDALDIAHGEIKKLVAAMQELREKAGKTPLEVSAPQVDGNLLDEVRN